MTGWLRVEAPWFCAAVQVEDDQITDAAPVLKWILMRRDRSVKWLESYAKRRRWKVEVIPEL